ncbi:MAG: DUF2249 domain-containing protein [Gammaproteobacteria bacterium]|nr:DUF2249 domain-containing protein [Gammaproteobacteria bacterium]
MTDLPPLTLDVREELRRGGEPLARILHAVGQLKPGQALRLLVTFEPLPLYAVLGRKGFSHQAHKIGTSDWEVLFSPGAAAPPKQSAAAPDRRVVSATDGWPAPSARLDNRGLEPPQPMVRILEALEQLDPGAVLEAINEREPVFLYPELEQRGAQIHTERCADGSVRLLIRRAGQVRA